MARGPDRLATGQEKIRVMEAGGGTPGKILVAGVGKASPPPTHSSRHQGGGGEEIVGTRGTATGQ